jgi:hypothetical protein
LLFRFLDFAYADAFEVSFACLGVNRFRGESILNGQSFSHDLEKQRIILKRVCGFQPRGHGIKLHGNFPTGKMPLRFARGPVWHFFEAPGDAGIAEKRVITVMNF